MLKSNHKKEALKKLEEMTLLYHELTEDFKKHVNDLYEARLISLSLIDKVEELMIHFVELPVDLQDSLNPIIDNKIQFKKNLEDVKQAQVYDQTLQTKGTTGAEVMAGVGTAAGVGVATLGPSAAMALATTFGTASTGAAISTLGGAAATNAALAWLGGGAIAAGGGGMAAGQALLALFGPIGWMISAATLVGSGAYIHHKNKKAATEAEEKYQIVYDLHKSLKNTDHQVLSLSYKTSGLNDTVLKSYQSLTKSSHHNDEELSEDEKYQLRLLLEHANQLAELLFVTIE